MIDYDRFAPSYAATRRAAPWLLETLAGITRSLPPASAVVEIGCGTGNYIAALREIAADCAFYGFDRSPGMLEQARVRQTSSAGSVDFRLGDAGQAFPFPAQFCDLAFAVDVIHHIAKLDVFFTETARILKSEGRLLLLTDSEDDIRNRSLSLFFPEIIDSELKRYPRFAVLDKLAGRAGLRNIAIKRVQGRIDIDDDFVAKLAQKCASALHGISENAFSEGMRRVEQARRQNAKWLSKYSVIHYRKI